jgi:DNA repair protein SbcC/Rad50
MRIESVTAVAFGPFRNVTLKFAPQLTVIYGPNEAGKSSWHAAIYAALCGMRRGRGQPRFGDRDF